MVLFHVVAVLGLRYRENLIAGISSEFIPLFSLGGFTTLSFPVFAGFIYRNAIGASFDGKKLEGNSIRTYWNFFVLSFILEAIRLFSIKFNFDYLFNWSVLHFISLSLLITSVLLTFGYRYLIIFTLSIIFLRGYLEDKADFLVVSSLEQLSSLLFVKVIYMLFVSFVLFSLGSFILNFIRKRKKFSLKLGYFVLVAIVLCIFYWGMTSYEWQSRTLLSFANLPHDMLFFNTVGDNVWPLFNFFPMIFFGFWFRDFFFKRENKKFILPVTISLFGYFVFYAFTQLKSYAEQMSEITIFSKLIYSADFYSVLFACTVHFIGAFIFFNTFRKIKIIYVEFVLNYFGNVLLIYVLHMIVLYSIVDLFPLLWNFALATTVLTYVVCLITIGIVYFMSNFLKLEFYGNIKKGK